MTFGSAISTFFFGRNSAEVDEFQEHKARWADFNRGQAILCETLVRADKVRVDILSLRFHVGRVLAAVEILRQEGPARLADVDILLLGAELKVGQLELEETDLSKMKGIAADLTAKMKGYGEHLRERDRKIIDSLRARTANRHVAEATILSSHLAVAEPSGAALSREERLADLRRRAGV